MNEWVVFAFLLLVVLVVAGVVALVVRLVRTPRRQSSPQAGTDARDS